jgi:hypothetical protein
MQGPQKGAKGVGFLTPMSHLDRPIPERHRN